VRNATGVAQIAVTNATLMGNHAAISSEIGGAAAAVTAATVSMTNNAYGVVWDGITGTAFDLRNMVVTGNGIGLQFSSIAASLKLRGSTVSGNADAGLALFSTIVADLGTQADPGLNTITGNTNVGLKMNLSAGQTVQAVGNTWIAGQQGADAGGHYSVAPTYAPVTVNGPKTGKNYSLLTGVTAIF
jgi:hypothetical protein